MSTLFIHNANREVFFFSFCSRLNLIYDGGGLAVSVCGLKCLRKKEEIDQKENAVVACCRCKLDGPFVLEDGKDARRENPGLLFLISPRAVG